jgi:hypothetical protein
MLLLFLICNLLGFVGTRYVLAYWDCKKQNVPFVHPKWSPSFDLFETLMWSIPFGLLLFFVILVLFLTRKK